MGKKWGPKKWYQYHLQKAINERVSMVVSGPQKEIDQIDEKITEIDLLIIKFVNSRTWPEWILSFFRTDDVESEIIKLRVIKESLLANRYAILDEIRELKIEAANSANKQFHDGIKSRKESRARRREERRIQYLERSKSIRSAQRYLKIVLIESAINDEGLIRCYYCNEIVSVNNVHIDHKHPVVRGGGNKRSNLALACVKCNLEKGRKTEREFIEKRGQV